MFWATHSMTFTKDAPAFFILPSLRRWFQSWQSHCFRENITWSKMVTEENDLSSAGAAIETTVCSCSWVRGSLSGNSGFGQNRYSPQIGIRLPDLRILHRLKDKSDSLLDHPADLPNARADARRALRANSASSSTLQKGLWLSASGSITNRQNPVSLTCIGSGSFVRSTSN